MDVIDTKRGPVSLVRLNHPTHLPVYKKVRNYEQHPREGPPMTLISGGTGARRLSETLIRFTHNSYHILPMFDDGGSSRELRQKYGMAPPGDLRNRLMALSDMTMSGNPEVSRLFRTRLPAFGTPEELQQELESFLDEGQPQMAKIERRYRRIIINHLRRFIRNKPDDFDLRLGNIGNFVIAGAYLSIGDLESVIFEFSALAAVRGHVIPVCRGKDYNLKAELDDGEVWIGQARITKQHHAPIRRLSIVQRRERAAGEAGEEAYEEVQPPLNPLAARAIRKGALIAYTMGSFYTSISPSLLVDGMGAAIRAVKRPKVLVANLVRDQETPCMTVSGMLREVLRQLRASDSQPGEMGDYVHYALVNDHGDSAMGGRVPVDLDAIRALGVEPIVLPVEDRGAEHPGLHDPRLVAAVLLSLC